MIPSDGADYLAHKWIAGDQDGVIEELLSLPTPVAISASLQVLVVLQSYPVFREEFLQTIVEIANGEA